MSTIVEIRERIQSLESELKMLKVAERRHTLNAEMNRIEAEMNNNWAIINNIKKEFRGIESDASKEVIARFENKNKILNKRWEEVYNEYFNLSGK